MPIVSSLLPEILKAIDRGVKVKLLIYPYYMPLAHVFLSRGKEVFDKVKKGVEMRLVHNFSSFFGVVDDSEVVLFSASPQGWGLHRLGCKYGMQALQKTWARSLILSGTGERKLTLKSLQGNESSAVSEIDK
jgi:hypothetical protein